MFKNNKKEKTQKVGNEKEKMDSAIKITEKERIRELKAFNKLLEEKDNILFIPNLSEKEKLISKLSPEETYKILTKYRIKDGKIRKINERDER